MSSYHLSTASRSLTTWVRWNSFPMLNILLLRSAGVLNRGFFSAVQLHSLAWLTVLRELLEPEKLIVVNSQNEAGDGAVRCELKCQGFSRGASRFDDEDARPFARVQFRRRGRGRKPRASGNHHHQRTLSELDLRQRSEVRKFVTPQKPLELLGCWNDLAWHTDHREILRLAGERHQRLERD